MEPSSGWGALSLKSNVFVDYFVMDIDPNLSSEDGGYLLYPSLKRDLFDHLIDYSETAAEKLTWTDKYLGETSFLKKWNLIKNRYESEKPDERIAYWYYVLGALILVTAILCFFPLFLKDKWMARKK